MKSKAKTYLWYWEAPFTDSDSPHYFDREHWWKKNRRDISHDSALYELLRRHPKVGNLQRERLGVGKEPNGGAYDFGSELVLAGPTPWTVKLENQALYHVATEIFFFSLLSWPRLSDEQRKRFHNSLKRVHPGKGRDLTKGVFDITQAAHAWCDSEKSVGGPSFEQCVEDLAKAYCSNDRLILAVDTTFASKKNAETALKEIAAIFWAYWRKPHRQTRVHESDWLTAIQEFECEFKAKGYEQFKLGYPKTFKKFIAHFENDETRALRAWWRRQGRASAHGDFQRHSTNR